MPGINPLQTIIVIFFFSQYRMDGSELMSLSCLLIQPKDPRVKDFAGSIYLYDLREEDEGTFVFQNSRSLYKSMTLTLSVKGKVILVLFLCY